MPVTVTRPAADLDRERRRLRHGVGGHDRFGRVGPAVRPRRGERRRQGRPRCARAAASP